MNGFLVKIHDWLGGLRAYLSGGFWDIDLSQCGVCMRFCTRMLRMLVIAVKGFVEDKCTLQASALTYITLVAIVPALAVTLAFCKGIGVQERLMSSIGIIREAAGAGDGGESTQYRYVIVQEESVEDSESAADGVAGGDGDSADGCAASPAPPAGERLRTVASQLGSLIKGESEVAGPSTWASSLPLPMQDALISLFTYVDRTNFAALGVVGLITMLVTVVMSIKKLENNFNSIWCIRKGRSLGRQFSEYLIVLLLTPLALLIVSTLATFVNNGGFSALFPAATASARFWNKAAGSSLLFGFVVASFVFMYIFMPNTKVRLGPAAFGGICAALIWGVVLWVYVRWQIGLASFNKIYGSFAALPFFLAWLYANWTVVLLGVEICYAAQNEQILRKGKHLRQMAPGACHILGLVIMNEVCRSFESGHGAWSATGFAAAHNISIREIEAAMVPLEQGGFVIRQNPDAPPPDCFNFVLGKPPEKISLAVVSEAYLGISSGDAERIARCLPPKFAAELKEHHQKNLDELHGLTFAAAVAEEG